MSGAKVEVNPRALGLLASAIIMILLWSRPILLAIYVTLVIGALLARILILPRRALAAERSLQRDALKLLGEGKHDALARLVEGQWLIRRFGRPYVLDQLLAMSAESRGDLEAAYAAFERAAQRAPTEEVAAARLNVARLALELGRREECELRLEALLQARPGFGPAVALQARLFDAAGSRASSQSET